MTGRETLDAVTNATLSVYLAQQRWERVLVQAHADARVTTYEIADAAHISRNTLHRVLARNRDYVIPRKRQ